MARRRPNEQRVQIAFLRPEDLRLHEFLAKRAYEARYEISTFILVSLHEAFKGQIEEDQVNALAEEAIKKVQSRTDPVEPPMLEPPPVEPPPAKPTKLSMEQAMKQAEAQIASLDAIASTVMKKKAGARKGAPSPPVPPA